MAEPGITDPASEPTDGPLVSCLCVTENRAAFMPWLIWCFDRQTWPRRELIIVDGSARPFTSTRSDVRVVAVPPGCNVAKKRNIAIDEACGEIITWFDDDDWQSPDKLRWLVAALGKGAPYVGSCRGWFVDLMARRCVPHRAASRQILFNSAGFLSQAVKSLRFPETVERASDTSWLRQLADRFRGRAAQLDQVTFFWLCHAGNLSNPAVRRRFPQPLADLEAAVGPEHWGDTGEALEALRARVRERRANASGEANAAPAAAPRARIRRLAEPAPAAADGTPSGKTAVPVGLMIKATALDAPWLGDLVPHMIAQAKYPFSERRIIVDRRTAFSGKYRERPAASLAELDAVLEELRSQGIVDEIVEVVKDPGHVNTVLRKYFSGDTSRISPYASTGGPIYPTLFGLETMQSEHVLQLDADVFFHSNEASWVAEALECMEQDPTLWLMMTHPGPPAGGVARSLGPHNARLARWDERLAVWRFSTATTRYFLCDRRKLRGRLRFVPMGNGCAPLEKCISDALVRHGAQRGALGRLHSWHLHAWYHGDPFPQWAPGLAEAVAAGRYPALQRGQYDLRLDRIPDRRAWQEILEGRKVDAKRKTARGAAPGVIEVAAAGGQNDRRRPGAGRDGERPRRPARAPVPETPSVPPAPSPQPSRGPAPIAVVIPVRNRGGLRLRNALRSLHWQTPGPPLEILVVSHGSHPEFDRDLAAVCSQEGARLLRIGKVSDCWNKPLALNAGIRETSSDALALMTMDADMILSENFLAVVMERLRREPPALVLCRSADLPHGLAVPGAVDALKAGFARLRARARLRPRFGSGGIQAARRRFFFEIRGYDEDLVWWGGMDGDVVQRARLAGLAIEWIEERACMLHQWHPRKSACLDDPRVIKEARTAWIRNHALARSRATAMARNPGGWGGVSG